MAAIKVYGVALGDQFIDPEGQTVKVERFITPAGPNSQWQAKLSSGKQVTVRELKHWSKP